MVSAEVRLTDLEKVSDLDLDLDLDLVLATGWDLVKEMAAEKALEKLSEKEMVSVTGLESVKESEMATVMV